MAQADMRGVSSNYPRNDCGTYLGSSFLLVSNVVNAIFINGAEQVLRPPNLNFLIVCFTQCTFFSLRLIYIADLFAARYL